jgi:predicted ATPase
MGADEARMLRLLAVHNQVIQQAQAIPYWQKAGQRAIRRSANVEAVGHFTKGLELLQTLPGTPERTRQELTLQIALGGALIATKGFDTTDLKEAKALLEELAH